MKNHVSALISGLLFLTFLYACHQQETLWKGSAEEKDGALVVNNPVEPMGGVDVFSLDEELAIDLYEFGFC